MKRIQILMSTYNGEAHLREQLDSYVALDNFDEVKVLIRDDGSSDGTVAILHEYAEKYGFEIIEGENVGLNASMFELVSRCDLECDYFSFSDQDDVWLPYKLSRAVSSLDSVDNSSPYLYAACSSITDNRLEIKGKTLIPKRPLSFYNAMIQNVCVGHTQVANRELVKLLRLHFSNDIYVYDSWVYTVASAFGKIIYDKTPTTLYRQHANNVVGYETKKLKNFVKRVKRLKTGKSRRYSYQLKAFCELYADMIPEEYRKESAKYFKRQRNVFTRFGYIFGTKMYRQTRTEGIVFRLMYLFGKYNLKKEKKSKEIKK